MAKNIVRFIVLSLTRFVSYFNSTLVKMSTRNNRRPQQEGSSTKQDPEEKLILIDTDAGTDDAWALFLALAAHKDSANTGVRIVGITTVCGNTTVANVSINVTRTLQTVNEESIPVYEGLGDFVMNEYSYGEEPPYHGYDGFGDANLPPISARLEEDHAVNAIIRLAEQYKDRLIIVALGPLTNLAMAIKLKPEIKNWIKEILVLGGNMDGLGNVTSSAEFNFYVDPEAAAIALDFYRPLSLTIVPWETGKKATSTLQFRTETLARINSPQITLLNAIEAANLGKLTDGWLPPDAVVMACAINPQIASASETYHARVEVNGALTRGMMAVDKDNILKKPKNVKLITNVDKNMYEDYLIWAAGGNTRPVKSSLQPSSVKRPRRV